MTQIKNNSLNHGIYSSFSQYIDLKDQHHNEGVSGKDNGQDAPSTKDKRLRFYMEGQIRNAWNALRGQYGAEGWLSQTRERLERALDVYRDESGTQTRTRLIATLEFSS